MTTLATLSASQRGLHAGRRDQPRRPEDRTEACLEARAKLDGPHHQQANRHRIAEQEIVQARPQDGEHAQVLKHVRHPDHGCAREESTSHELVPAELAELALADRLGLPTISMSA